MRLGANQHTKVGGPIGPPSISLEQAAELLNVGRRTVIASKRLGDNQHKKEGVQICTPSISLPAHGFNGPVDKWRRFDFRPFALALARAAQLIYGLPGEPLQTLDELLLRRDLFRVVQRNSKVSAAVRT
jgi:hypothetical protein